MEDKYLKNHGLRSLKHTQRLQVSISDSQHCSQLNKKNEDRQLIRTGSIKSKHIKCGQTVL